MLDSARWAPIGHFSVEQLSKVEAADCVVAANVAAYFTAEERLRAAQWLVGVAKQKRPGCAGTLFGNRYGGAVAVLVT